MKRFLTRRLEMKIASLVSVFALIALSASPVLAADYNPAVLFTGNINGSFTQHTGGDFFEGSLICLIMLTRGIQTSNIDSIQDSMTYKILKNKA